MGGAKNDMDRYAEIKKKILHYAESDEEIKAVVAIGSSTRDTVLADEFSDLDLIIATTDPDKWFSGEYPRLLGNVSISFIEPTLGGGKERRSIYDDDKHDGRFIARWADEFILRELKFCFAHYDTEDVKAALVHTHQLFAKLARAVAEKLDYAYPDQAEKCAEAFTAIRQLDL